MITINLWNKLVIWKMFGAEEMDYLLALLGSFITIPLDIILCPIELMGLLAYKIGENWRKKQ